MEPMDTPRDPFPGNIIPASRISGSTPRRSSVLVPDPKIAGIFNNYPASENSRNDNRNFTFKIDHQLTSNHRLSGAWNDGKNTDSGPLAVLPHPISATRNGVLGPAQKTLRLSHDWVIIANRLSTTCRQVIRGSISGWSPRKREAIGPSSWASPA